MPFPNLFFASSRNLRLSCGRLLYQGFGSEPSPTIERRVSGKKLGGIRVAPLNKPNILWPRPRTYKIMATKLIPHPIARIQNIHLQLKAYERIPPSTGP